MLILKYSLVFLTFILLFNEFFFSMYTYDFNRNCKWSYVQVLKLKKFFKKINCVRFFFFFSSLSFIKNKDIFNLISVYLLATNHVEAKKNFIVWKSCLIIFKNLNSNKSNLLKQQSSAIKIKNFFLKRNQFYFYKNSFIFDKLILFYLVKKCAIVYSYKIRLKIKLKPINFFKKLTNNIVLKNKIYFLRKNKLFGKSRYSRNRQTYRTGVYWCLWVSIFLGFGLYFIFYRFTLNFGFLWWPFFFFLNMYLFLTGLRLKFFSAKQIVVEVKKLSKWFYFKSLNSSKYTLFIFKRANTYKNKYPLILVFNSIFNKIKFSYSFNLLVYKYSFKDFFFNFVYLINKKKKK